MVDGTNDDKQIVTQDEFEIALTSLICTSNARELIIIYSNTQDETIKARVLAAFNEVELEKCRFKTIKDLVEAKGLSTEAQKEVNAAFNRYVNNEISSIHNTLLSDLTVIESSDPEIKAKIKSTIKTLLPRAGRNGKISELSKILKKTELDPKIKDDTITALGVAISNATNDFRLVELAQALCLECVEEDTKKRIRGIIDYAIIDEKYIGPIAHLLDNEGLGEDLKAKINGALRNAITVYERHWGSEIINPGEISGLLDIKNLEMGTAETAIYALARSGLIDSITQLKDNSNFSAGLDDIIQNALKIAIDRAGERGMPEEIVRVSRRGDLRDDVREEVLPALRIAVKAVIERGRGRLGFSETLVSNLESMGDKEINDLLRAFQNPMKTACGYIDQANKRAMLPLPPAIPVKTEDGPGQKTRIPVGGPSKQ